MAKCLRKLDIQLLKSQNVDRFIYLLPTFVSIQVHCSSTDSSYNKVGHCELDEIQRSFEQPLRLFDSSDDVNLKVDVQISRSDNSSEFCFVEFKVYY